MFHVFPRYASSWPNVLPGDVVISPSSVMTRHCDYVRNFAASNSVIVQQKPLIIIAVFDGTGDSSGLYSPQHDMMFIVYSVTMGVLVCFKNRVDSVKVS